jgi:hypothetical protein
MPFAFVFVFAVVSVLFFGGVVCLVCALCLGICLVFVADKRVARERQRSSAWEESQPYPRQSEAVSVAAHITLPHGFAKISLHQQNADERTQIRQNDRRVL